jgi:hypothetical protein
MLALRVPHRVKGNRIVISVSFSLRRVVQPSNVSHLDERR